MRIAIAVLLLVNAACSSPAPSPDPTGVIRVRNESAQAVMVTVGSTQNGAGSVTAARPCGGEVTVQVRAGDYLEDGRLVAALAIDPTGQFDRALAELVGDGSAMPDTFTSAVIWSDGTLAGRLPLSLTVAPDRTVTEGPLAAPRSVACVPGA